MVIGDIIADEFIVGEPERLSREAPVLILRHKKRVILPGGGANVSNNITSLGGQVRLIGLIGNDNTGQHLRKIMFEKGINIEGVISTERPTSVKTRILAGGDQIVKQQVVRVDHLDNSPITKNRQEKIFNRVKKDIDNVDAVLLSDYGNGLFTSSLISKLIKLIKSKNKIVAVDTRYNLLQFKGATIATRNLEETGYALNCEIKTKDEVIKGGKELITRLNSEYLLITQGGDGMTLFTSGGDYTHIPVANLSEVYDVTGAGDTVVGTLILALGTQADVIQAVKLANYAAGIVVRKTGVATVNSGELTSEVQENER